MINYRNSLNPRQYSCLNDKYIESVTEETYIINIFCYNMT